MKLTHGDSFSPLMEGLLDLLTVRKYRLLQALYLFFRITDNVMFVVLILSSIFNFVLSPQDWNFVTVFAVVGVELFYDILSFTTKIWIINRLGVYIGFILYIFYFIALYLLVVKWWVWVLLGLRFIVYLLESGVDYALDVEIHNDLISTEPEKCEFCLPTDLGLRSDQKHTKDPEDVKNLDLMRKLYRGSMCSWTYVSAFKKKFNTNPTRHTLTRLWFYLPSLLLVIISLPLLIPLVFICIVLKCCCKDCAEEIVYF